MKEFAHLPFAPAQILMPRDCRLSLWSVVACDQYTSQPEYWQRVEQRVGEHPSALHLILPESRLEGDGVEENILRINQTMENYLAREQFTVYPDSLFYVERRLDCGKIRRGLVGMVDLESYHYAPGSDALVRATEGTVLSRIPPRVAVRKNAPIELPHVMLLADDPQRTLIEPLGGQTGQMEMVYDFELMERGGRIRGWRLSREQMAHVAEAMAALADPDAFAARYGVQDKPVLLFAVGDGNHSLATAKECYEQQKKQTAPEQWANLPARYALCELVNLHDESLEFEAIHRVVFGVEPERLLSALREYYPSAHDGAGEQGHVLEYVYGQNRGAVTVAQPAAQLAVGTLQAFLDEYVAQTPGAKVDYIHGEDVVLQLSAREGAIGFILPPMGKQELFPTVIHDGVLPRKTFSMGEAHDKRFYLEARKIRE